MDTNNICIWNNNQGIDLGGIGLQQQFPLVE